MSAHGKLASQFTISKNLDSFDPAIGQPCGSQGRFVHPRAVFKAVQQLKIDGQIFSGMPGVVEAPFWDTTDQRHLSTFEPDTNGTARSGRLALAAAPAGFAVAARFALAQPLAPMPGTGTRFDIV